MLAMGAGDRILLSWLYYLLLHRYYSFYALLTKVFFNCDFDLHAVCLFQSLLPACLPTSSTVTKFRGVFTTGWGNTYPSFVALVTLYMACFLQQP